MATGIIIFIMLCIVYLLLGLSILLTRFISFYLKNPYANRDINSSPIQRIFNATREYPDLVSSMIRESPEILILWPFLLSTTE